MLFWGTSSPGGTPPPFIPSTKQFWGPPAPWYKNNGVLSPGKVLGLNKLHFHLPTQSKSNLSNSLYWPCNYIPTPLSFTQYLAWELPLIHPYILLNSFLDVKFPRLWSPFLCIFPPSCQLAHILPILAKHPPRFLKTPLPDTCKLLCQIPAKVLHQIPVNLHQIFEITSARYLRTSAKWCK